MGGKIRRTSPHLVDGDGVAAECTGVTLEEVLEHGVAREEIIGGFRLGGSGVLKRGGEGGESGRAEQGSSQDVVGELVDKSLSI